MSGRHTTARGDRAQRRIDVVDAAASILDESGWAGLNMREVARRAGVSAGALYQWFAGKDEIYAELYTTRLTQGAASLAALPDDITLEALLGSVLRWIRRTWRDIGRWQLEFTEISRTRRDSDALKALADAHQHLVEFGLRHISEQAAAEGLSIRADAASADLVWATATGIAMRSEVLGLSDEHVDELVAIAVHSLIAGLTESA